MTKSTFTKMHGRSTFNCCSCGRLTRDVDQGGTDLCPECYELAGMDNTCNDDGRTPDADEAKYSQRLLKSIAKKGGNVQKAIESNEYLFPHEAMTQEIIMESKTKTTKSKKPAAKKAAKKVAKKPAAKKAAKSGTFHVKCGKGDGMYVTHCGDDGVQLTTDKKLASTFEDLATARACAKKLRKHFRVKIV